MKETRAGSEDHVIQPIPSEEEDRDSYVPVYRVISYPSDPTLKDLYERLVAREIEVPEFQRGWVWSHAQASRLIESFLMGLPVPSIFLYRKPNQKELVIDGQQRLRSVRAYFEGTLPEDKGAFFLKGVNPKWEGKAYTDLDQADQLRFKNSVLRTMIVEQLNPEDDSSIYHIFERLNMAGTALTPQEVRNCVRHGPFNNLLIELNRDKTWREIFGAPRPDPRMRDTELILRFIALYESSDKYTKPMKIFLNNFMRDKQNQNQREPYEGIFLKTVGTVTKSLGRRPFHIKRGINAAVFDAVVVAFARGGNPPPDIGDRMSQLLANPSFQKDTSAGTTDVDTVKRRIGLAQKILFN